MRYRRKPKKVFAFKGLFKGMQHALVEFDKVWMPYCNEIVQYASERSSLNPKYGSLDLFFRVDLRVGRQSDHTTRTFPCFWVTTHAQDWETTELYIPHSFQIPFEYLCNNHNLNYMMQMASVESKQWIDEMFNRRAQEIHKASHK